MTHEEKWLLEEKYQGKETPEFEADKGRLATGEPVDYVIGWQPFFGLKIYLDSRPLIPRPETEWWVEQVLGKQNTKPFSCLDLCAGSGAIGCTILKYMPNAKVSFGEIDPAHESTILKNVRKNNLDASHATVRIGDLFAPFAGEQFDLILANPPYIPEERMLEASVTDFEPRLALRAGTDGLEIIRRIAGELRTHLAPKGEAWIECDSEHAEQAQKLFEARDLSVKTLMDQYNRPRVLVVSLAQ